MLFQLMAMTPWLDKGFVTFIPNPGDFDRALFVKTVKSAEERLKDQPITDSEVNESMFVQHARRKLLSGPSDYLERKLREVEPNITDEEARHFLESVERERLADPFQTGKTMDQMPPQLMAARSGANLEMGLYICQAIGAFPYTNMRYRRKEILSAREQFDSTAEVWTPLTKAFQGLDFKFLDHVSPKFAYAMREEDRLGGFRSYLRKVWQSIDGSPDPAQAARLARDFRDELSESYQTAKKEWDEIDIDLLKYFGGGGVLAAAGSAFSHGKLSLEIPAAGFVLNSVIQLIQAHLKRRNFRNAVPMSAFIDLDQESRK